MIKLNIDVTKIPREEIKSKPEWKGKFISCILVNKPNDRGDDGFISMDVTKEQRAAGVRGAIIGNWREISQGGRQSKTESDHAKAKSNGYQPQPDDAEDLPF